ncbi:MAG: helix-turn-helix transcriptional regulator [Chthoniobacterales bacterium]|nr:helix-turn-helix transcriptional regulator [Chthoniobacterales bacterium]
MLEQELTRLLSVKRRMPSPYRGQPRLFFGAGRLMKGEDYDWDGLKRNRPPEHPQLLFQYTFSGCGLFTRANKQHRMEKGRAFFAVIPSAHVYKLPPDSPGWNFFYLTFQHPHTVSRIAAALEQHCGVIELDERHPLITKSADLIRLTQNGVFADSYEEEAHIFDWMCAAERELREPAASPKESHIWQNRVLAVLNKNPAAPPSIEELAAYFDLTRSHFTRIFKDKTGDSPAAFITQFRIHRIEQDLRLTGKTLEEIACDHGYGDTSRLCKVFRKSYGMSPGAYRKLNCRRSGAPDGASR